MSEEKKGLLNRELTRRQFMKLSAKGMTGVALSSSLMSLMGITKAQADSGQVDVYPTPTHLLVVNRAKCTSCQRCETNCSMANDGKAQPYLARVRVRDNTNFGSTGPDADFIHGEGYYGNWTFEPKTCKQCADPACLKACPVQAIYISDTNGARLIDKEKCVGCGLCATACPWGMPRVDPEERKSTKCVNCGACVRGCPTSALKMIDWEDVATAL